MEKRLREYEKRVRETLKKGKVSEDFWDYHKEKVAEFQHERLVHLIITLFFAVLAIGVVVSRFFIMDFFDESFYGVALNIVNGILVAILVVLTVAYVRHYYQLENGVQRLYVLTDEIVELR